MRARYVHPPVMRRRPADDADPRRPAGVPVEPEGASDLPASVRRVAAKGLGRRSLDALRVGVLVLDAEDRPVLVNPAAKEMGLLRAGTGVGGPPVAHTVVRTLAGQARRTGTRREVELDHPRGNGRDPLGVHLRAVALGDGHVTVEAADVTEAHRVARVRRDFVANVSHELKTPVGAVQLVSELLDLARLQGGEPLPELAPVSVDRIIAEVIDRTRTPASMKGLEVGVAGTRGLTVYGSESQLMAAVANLAENAVAYSPDAEENQAPSRVTITARGNEDWVEIAVSDQGIGIEPKDLDRIFERFYRADRARSRATGGTGLGLAIVKHVATNHGGHVEVASTVGIGSTFTLRLPARPPEEALPLPLSVEIAADAAELKGSA